MDAGTKSHGVPYRMDEGDNPRIIRLANQVNANNLVIFKQDFIKISNQYLIATLLTYFKWHNIQPSQFSYNSMKLKIN